MNQRKTKTLIRACPQYPILSYTDKGTRICGGSFIAGNGIGQEIWWNFQEEVKKIGVSVVVMPLPWYLMLERKEILYAVRIVILK